MEHIPHLVSSQPSSSPTKTSIIIKSTSPAAGVPHGTHTGVPSIIDISVPKDLETDSNKRDESTALSHPISNTVSPSVDQNIIKLTPGKKKEQTLTSPSSISYITSSAKGAANPKRQMELDAYGAVISAFKLQGELTWKKENVLQDLRAMLKISEERHRMELKRAEETLFQLIPSQSGTPTRKKRGGAYNFDQTFSAESSEYESNSDNETGRRKKRVTRVEDKESYLTAQALPNSDYQPSSVGSKVAPAKVTPKPKTTKKDPVEKKKGGPRAKKQVAKPSEDKVENFGGNEISSPIGDIKSLGVGDTDMLEGYSGEHLEEMKQLLEQKKQTVREELLKMQK